MTDSLYDRPNEELGAPQEPPLPEHRSSHTKSRMPKEMLGVVGLVIVLVGIGATYILAGRNSYDKSKAASATGTALFNFSLPAGQTAMTPNAATTLTLKASGLGQSQVDGFQIIASVTGSVPTTMTFTPATVTGLSTAAQSVSDVANGKRLTAAFVTANPSVPFNANGATVTLGTLSFVAPASGTMTISIDQMTSKILQSVTGTDILANQGSFAFSVSAPPPPPPTATPTIAPTVAPTATPIVTPRPTATPIATIMPTIVPTVRPTATPAPTAIVTPRPTATPIATIMPTIVPVPTATPVPGTASCSLNSLSVVPYPDSSAWNTTGQFMVTNKSTKAMTFNWSLSNWTNGSQSKSGATTLQPGKTTTLGLGQICSQWSLNISCATGTDSLGYTVESNPSACAVVTPAPTAIATPRPTLPPVPGGGTWRDFLRRWFGIRR